MRKRFNQGHIVILLFKHCRTSRWMVAGPLQEAVLPDFLPQVRVAQPNEVND
jgi:hypothetical protein